MRKTPYTVIGIRRIPCFRCGEPSVHQWQICSDNHVFRGVCNDCDIALNRLILEFFGFDDIEDKMKRYINED